VCVPVIVCECVVPAMCTHLVCMCPSLHMQGSPCVRVCTCKAVHVCVLCTHLVLMCPNEMESRHERERGRRCVWECVCLHGVVAMCCIALQSVAVGCFVLQRWDGWMWMTCSGLQWGAVRCHVLPCLDDVIQMSFCRGL